MTSRNSRSVTKNEPFTTSAESAALTGEGAAAWAVGSQKCIGTSAVLSRSAATMSARPVSAATEGWSVWASIRISRSPVEA